MSRSRVFHTIGWSDCIPPGTLDAGLGEITLAKTSVCKTRMSDLHGLRVLVIEDDPDARELMQTVLEQRHAEVFAADSVRSAFEMLETTKPDVIVSDIAMPEEDGVAFIYRLRTMPTERGGKIPAIAVSAYVAPADRARALRAGFDLYLHKPVDFGELVTAVHSLLARAPTTV